MAICCFKGRYTLDFGAEAVAEGKIQPVVASASASASTEPTEPSEDALVSDAASPSASATASASAAGPASRVTVQECDFRGRYHADSKMWELSVAYGATVQVPPPREALLRAVFPPRARQHPVRLPCPLLPLLLRRPLPPPRRLSSS